MNSSLNYEKVLNFWFAQENGSKRFKKDPEFDQQITTQFEATHYAATQGETFEWRTSAQGRLAEVIVLDQFSRNMFRDQKEAFSFDPLALALAQEAVLGGHHKNLSQNERAFLYMPFMHSESLKIHDWAVELFSEPGMESYLDYEHQHRNIIARFDRYPHRNQILGRTSTPEEIEFLKQKGSSF